MKNAVYKIGETIHISNKGYASEANFKSNHPTADFLGFISKPYGELQHRSGYDIKTPWPPPPIEDAATKNYLDNNRNEELSNDNEILKQELSDLKRKYEFTLSKLTNVVSKMTDIIMEVGRP